MSLFSPQWIALCREAAIAGQSISAGLGALRKANYAATGLYSHAFFSLSIGIERLLKIIYLVDYAIGHEGKFPGEADLRKQFGHDIQKLFDYALSVHVRLPKAEHRYPISVPGIELDIIEFLSKFARTTRYYNLDYLVGATAAAQGDPIREWYRTIGSQILQRHYTVLRREKDFRAAAFISSALEGHALIRHTAEDGSPLNDLLSASLQTGENKIIQKYGTFYSARMVRFLYMILYDLDYASHAARLEVPALYEFFFPFLNDDSYLLSRRTFPPIGQGR